MVIWGIFNDAMARVPDFNRFNLHCKLTVTKTYIVLGSILRWEVQEELLYIPIKYWLQMWSALRKKTYTQLWQSITTRIIIINISTEQILLRQKKISAMRSNVTKPKSLLSLGPVKSSTFLLKYEMKRYDQGKNGSMQSQVKLTTNAMVNR